jgi:predicted phosphodiesterase
MRLAVLGDVHDNLPALEAVVEDLRRQGVDGIIAAGDYVVRGPFPLEVNRLLRSLDAWMIRGNTEGYVLAYDAGQAPAPWYTSDQWAAMRWTCEQLDRQTLDFLRSLPEQRVIALDGIPPICVVHGSPGDPSGRLIPDRDAEALRWFRAAGFLSRGAEAPGLGPAFSQIDESVLICAHTHIPWVQEEDGKLACNPGAVSGALNGDPRAQYALLTWRDDRWQVDHRALPYDVDRVRHAFRDRGLLAEGGVFARAFLLNVVTGRNVVGHLFSHVDQLAATSGHADWVVVPDAVWDRAVSTFPWDDYTDGLRR